MISALRAFQDELLYLEIFFWGGQGSHRAAVPFDDDDEAYQILI